MTVNFDGRELNGVEMLFLEIMIFRTLTSFLNNK